MRNTTLTLYQFDELSDKAKNRAREWWRECAQEFGGFGELWEPAEIAAKILGIDFAQVGHKLHGGGTRYEPDIRYSGFSCQGDGASFVGTYKYAKGASKKIRAEFGTDEKLWAIADELTAIQKRNQYRITANISQNGHYYHEMTMSAEVFKGDDYALRDTADEVSELMHDFAKWIYRGLEAEYEYRMSDESVDDSIRANEYEFTAEGEIYV